MKEYDNYKAELKELFTLYDDEELAKKLDITVRSLQNYRAGGNITKKVIRKINELFVKVKAGEASASYAESTKNPGLKSQDVTLSDQSFNNLTESNKALAYANQRLADAHFIIAKNNDELLQMAKGTTVQNGLKTTAILEARLTVLSNFLAKIGSGYRYPSYEEAVEALGSAWLGIEDHQKGQEGSLQEYGRPGISQKSS